MLHRMEIKISKSPIEYPFALETMEQRVADIRAETAEEMLWLLEHPPLYTAGTSAKAQDLIDARFPVFDTGRGGQYTYHGPGQRVGYLMIDLKKRQKTPDIKQYVWQLEELIIRTLAQFDIEGYRSEGRIGIWVKTKDGAEKKIAALGVRVRHWITFHGIAINVDPDLSHFGGIVPCGISNYGVTSMAELTGYTGGFGPIDAALRESCAAIFGEPALKSVA
jgi:lipoyl(octanoyl) transferase